VPGGLALKSCRFSHLKSVLDRVKKLQVVNFRYCSFYEYVNKSTTICNGGSEMFSKSLFIFFLVCPTAFGAELVLSRSDSGRLARDTIFPFKSTEIISENGREIALTTRELISDDELLRFSCETKNDAGQIVDISCRVFIDLAAEPLNGNERIEGIEGMLRATIAASDDIFNLKESFQNSGVCRSDLQTQLYSAAERREITFPNGTVRPIPLLTISCQGNSATGLSKLLVTLLPRE
jgi:hypothetical protein